MADAADRRHGPRVSVFNDVTVELPTETLSATALDVGVGGVAIWGPGPAPRGPIKITMELEDASISFEVDGEVVREFESDGGAVWGVAFRGLDDSTRDQLQAFVDGRAEQPAA